MPRRCPPIPELSTYWRQGTHIILTAAAIWGSRRHKLCRVFTRPGTTEARSVAADAGRHGIINHGNGNYSVSSAFATWSGDSFSSSSILRGSLAYFFNLAVWLGGIFRRDQQAGRLATENWSLHNCRRPARLHPCRH